MRVYLISKYSCVRHEDMKYKHVYRIMAPVRIKYSLFNSRIPYTCYNIHQRGSYSRGNAIKMRLKIEMLPNGHQMQNNPDILLQIE
jgi:hypothetical protein